MPFTHTPSADSPVVTTWPGYTKGEGFDYTAVGHRDDIIAGKELADHESVTLWLRAQMAASKLGGTHAGTAAGLSNGLANVPVVAGQFAARNLLINPFRFAQRQVPSTLTTVADNVYGADRWKCHREGAAGARLSYRRYRRGDAGENFTNIKSRDYGHFERATDSGKLMFIQILEANNTYQLIGVASKFSIKLRALSARTMRIGIIEWSGTEDVAVSTISVWGATSVDPTFTSASYVLKSAKSILVTPAMQTFSITHTPTSTAKNIIVAVWSDAAFANADWVQAAEPIYGENTDGIIWTPRADNQELALAQRFYWKSYPEDTAPGTTTIDGYLTIEAYTTLLGNTMVRFPNMARVALPTISIFSYVGTAGDVGAVVGGADHLAVNNAIAAQISRCGFSTISHGSTVFVVGTRYIFHATVEGEL